MAFSGVHITCGFAGGSGRNGLTLQVIQKPVWSQTMASAGTTSNAAPNGGQFDGEPIFYIATSIAIFVAIGPNPDAVNGPRTFIPLDTSGIGGISLFGAPGDKVAWVAA